MSLKILTVINKTFQYQERIGGKDFFNDVLDTFYLLLYVWEYMELDIWLTTIDNKEGNVLFNNALNTFCIDNKRNPTTATL